MFVFEPAKHWNPRQAELRGLLLNRSHFTQAVPKLLDLHAQAHPGEVSGAEAPTLCDILLENLPDAHCRIMPTKRDVTIAWCLWHLARIEDITMNLLVAGGDQVFNRDWQGRMGAAITDTANALTDPEIIALSQALDLDALRAYRSAVGIRSREIVRALAPEDLKRRPDPAQVDRILPEGGLTEHPDSLWLRDFWGKKTVAGLLLLPLTRHQCMHLNDMFKLKNRLAKQAAG